MRWHSSWFVVLHEQAMCESFLIAKTMQTFVKCFSLPQRETAVLKMGNWKDNGQSHIVAVMCKIRTVRKQKVDNKIPIQSYHIESAEWVQIQAHFLLNNVLTSAYLSMFFTLYYRLSNWDKIISHYSLFCP